MAEEAEVWLFGGPLSPAVRPFFRDLLGVSASRMAKEPAALSAERERLAAEIEGAAVENYRGFLELAKCVDESGALVRLVGSRGEEAGRGMRRFREEAEQVEDGVAEISREQKKNQAMLQVSWIFLDSE